MDGKQSNVAQKIIDWLGKSPRWYSQALKLAASKPGATKSDIDALACQAAQEQKVSLPLPSDGDLPCITQEEIETLCHLGRGVLLEGISDAHCVNNVRDGEKLDFSTEGLTLIYGYNGSGKTGYSRMLRNVCSSRGGVPTVLPNVFSSETDTPSASITAKVDGVETTLKWSSGETDHVAFPEVAVFDRECSQAEVAKDHEVSYVPTYFSALETLVRIVDDTRNRIDEIATDEKSSAAFPVSREQNAKHLLDEVCRLQSMDNVDSWLSSQALTESERVRLAEIPGLLAALPEREIPGLQSRKRQVDAIRRALGAYLKDCTEERMKAYHEAQDAATAAQNAVNLSAQQLGDTVYLEGVGNSTWRALWQAAKDYSEQSAYPGVGFPNVEAGARCPLCQQTLTPEAASRFTTFDAFIKGATTARLDKCNKAIHDIESGYEGVRIGLINVKASLGSIVDDETRSSLESFITELEVSDSRFYSSDDVAYASEHLVACLDSLSKESRAIDDKIEAINGNANPETSKKLAAERDSLNARDWISSNAPSIRNAMTHLIAAHDADRVSHKINSRAISRFVGDLSKSEINDAYKQAFNEELKFFFKADPRVQLTTRTTKGSTVAGLVLIGAGIKASPSNVFSEGELKVLSLAGFFANLRLQQRPSTVVFDDPVTSLDHLWRKAVAQRISIEAQDRPVVVFTHDPVFSIELSSEVDSLNVPIATRYVSRRLKTSGYVSDELPWEAVRTSKRVKSLKNTAQELKKLEKSGAPEFSQRIRYEYSRLRSLWERAVEEVLLGGVIERYSPVVHTQQLRGLDRIEKDDIDTVTEAMTKCSRITEAHDTPSVTQDPLPGADEFEQDVIHLEDWTRDVRKRTGR